MYYIIFVDLYILHTDLCVDVFIDHLYTSTAGGLLKKPDETSLLGSQLNKRKI